MSAEVGENVDRVRERFDLIVNGPAMFNAVIAGLELGVFALLDQKQSADLEDLGAATGLAEQELRVLMQALCATELVWRTDGRYHNSAVATDLLVPDGDDSWLRILRGWQRIYYPAFPFVTEALRTGRNVALDGYDGSGATLYERLGHDPALESVMHEAMAAFTLRTLDSMISQPVFADARHLLDIGGGDGTVAGHLVNRYPDLRITIFDLPTMAGRAATGSAPTAGRISTCPGDLFDCPFPRGVDTVLFSHVLEVFSGDEILALLTKAHDVLPVGGKVVIYGFNPDDDETSGLYSARLSLYVAALATGRGRAYPARDYVNWLRQAGFAEVESTTGMPYEHGIQVATK